MGLNNGQVMGVDGTTVEVWSSSINKTNDQVTVTYTKAASGTTDSNGNVSFQLSEGE